MAANSKYSILCRNALLAALIALANGGKLRVYDGTQPIDADTAITTQNLLCEFTLPNPSFGSPGSGSINAAVITPAQALRAGTATWYRVVEADGATVVCDGSAGAANANLILSTAVIALPSQVSISSWSISAPVSGT